MAREDEIIKKATSYATEALGYDSNGNEIPQVIKWEKDAFIAGAKWADEHPSLESTQYKYIMQRIQEKIDHLELLAEKFFEVAKFEDAAACNSMKSGMLAAWLYVVYSTDPNKLAEFNNNNKEAKDESTKQSV